MTPVAPARAIEPRTELLDLRLGGRFTSLVESLAIGGFELDQGRYISFDDWYTPRRPEVTVQFLTILSPEFALTWGFSTGARGRKFRIDPSVQLGIVYQYQVIPNGWLTLTLTGVIGGNLTEKACIGDWPALGGPQRVNCRFADEPIAPRKTLRALENRKGYRDSRVTLTFEYRF